MEPAIWASELAIALSGPPETKEETEEETEDRGHLYIVEPTGPFEDDQNLTNKRFAGNRTESYRTREPLKIVGIVETWEGHSPETIQSMIDALEDLKRQGLHVIED
jgi:hypothetical protein